MLYKCRHQNCVKIRKRKPEFDLRPYRNRLEKARKLGVIKIVSKSENVSPNPN